MKDFNAEGATRGSLVAIAEGWRRNVEAAQRLAAPAVRRGYSVNVYDCAGQYSETSCPDFPAALAEYRTRRAKYPGKVVAVFNYDRCDERFDGLTEDEREALDD